MKKILSIFILLVGVSPVSIAQILIQGRVVDSETQEHLKYVNVVKSGSQSGTYSNEAGKFDISVSMNDTLLFSTVGYKTRSLAVSQIRKMDFIILLYEDTTLLQSVTINAKKTKAREYSLKMGYHNSRKKGRHVLMSPGIQLGVFIPNTSAKEGILDEVLINLASSGKTILRLRVMSADNTGKPIRDIYNESIYITVGKKHGVLKVDLRERNIPLPVNGVVIALEYIGNLDEKGKLIQVNGQRMNAELFYSQNDTENNTWSSMRGHDFRKDAYTTGDTNSNVMIGIMASFWR